MVSNTQITPKIAFPPHFFVTATDTDVGKSVVSAILACGLHAGYWKPIQAGIHPCTDTEWVQKVTNLPAHHFFPESYRLHSSLSPHAAAAIDGVQIELKNISLPQLGKLSNLIVEGAGGLLVPINAQHFMLDLIVQLKIPVLVVCRSTLGTINHTLLTLRLLRAHAIPILGVVVNGPKNASNCEAIATYGHVPILAEIAHMPHLHAYALRQSFIDNFCTLS